MSFISKLHLDINSIANANLGLRNDSGRRLSSLLHGCGRGGSLDLGLDVLNLGRLFVNLVSLGHCRWKRTRERGV